MTSHTGELAALTTAALWSVTSVLFTLAGRQVAPYAVNLFRTIIGGCLLAATLWLANGSPWPSGAPPGRLLDLAVSGVIGLAIGDTLLFQSYAWIGPRLATLLMALAPPMSAAIAWLGLGEHLGGRALLGMALALAGIIWVVRERGVGSAAAAGPARRRLGILLGLGAAACQAIGAVLSKHGMVGVDPLPATLVRMVSGAAGILAAALASGHLPRALPALRARRFLALALGASVLCPYLGVWLSLVSLKLTETGVALTLMAMSPILVIPLAARVFGERATARTVAGTVVAVAGVAILVSR